MSAAPKPLLPCPFCRSADWKSPDGGTVRPVMRRARSLGPDRYHYHIMCGSCGFDGPRGLTAQQAIDGWNRRATLSDERIEEIVSMNTPVIDTRYSARLATPRDVERAIRQTLREAGCEQPGTPTATRAPDESGKCRQHGG